MDNMSDAALEAIAAVTASEPEPQSNEREQVAEVFGLTGGELEETAWVPMFDVAKVTNTLTRCEPFTFTYWYQGIPGYAAEDFETAPTYRTVCNQELYGMVPDVVTDDEGTWKVVARFRTSGETECPGKNSSIPGVADERGLNIMDTPCPLCEENPQSFHGHIYIGDGWAEIVYRLEPMEHQASPSPEGEYAEGDGSSCAVCGEPVQFILGRWEHED